MLNTPRWLVTVADDFGKSPSVNKAIAEAFDKGILTTASLMPSGRAFEEAVAIAKARPRLSVGIHVTLCDGAPVLEPWRIPALTARDGCFDRSPVKAWLRYSTRTTAPELEREIRGQFVRIAKCGIRMSHVDGHHHIHMHPAVFPIVCRQARRHSVSWVRIPGEPLAVVLRTSAARGIMPLLEWGIFSLIGRGNRSEALRCGLRVADNVYGLADTGALTESRFFDLAFRSGGPVTEIFAHPDKTSSGGLAELAMLTSERLARSLREIGVAPTGYQELSNLPVSPRSRIA